MYRTNNLSAIVEIALQKQIPFALYSFPGSGEMHFLAQTHERSLPASKNLGDGFIFAPFNSSLNSKIFLFTDIKGEINKDGVRLLGDLDKSDTKNFISRIKKDDCYVETDRETYLQKINNAVSEIRKGSFSKVVLSRVKKVLKPNDFKIANVYKALKENHENALVYLFSHPATGIWCGASPEMLVSIKNNHLTTMALAGTKPAVDAVVPWGEKELIEQNLVAEYVENCLRTQKGFEILSKNGPVTAPSGNISHLKTVFEARLKSHANTQELIDRLHPTPAVCGLPKKAALHFIHAIEKHRRDYYTGYLGPYFGIENQNLFVNLRCFKVLKDELAIFVGGGITKNSVPEKEWNETEQKALTILNVLEHQTKLCEN